jgi:hypothetical protein
MDPGFRRGDAPKTFYQTINIKARAKRPDGGKVEGLEGINDPRN